MGKIEHPHHLYHHLPQGTGEYMTYSTSSHLRCQLGLKISTRCFVSESHTDAECNARLILNRLDDQLNRRVGLQYASAEVKKGNLVVGGWRRFVL